MYVERLNHLADHIEAHPEELDMANWHSAICALETNESKTRRTISCTFEVALKAKTPCKTAHCIAGTTEMLYPKVRRFSTVPENAGFILGLNKEQQESLFFMIHWPDRFTLLYGKTSDLQERATIVANRIRHMVATGECCNMSSHGDDNSVRVGQLDSLRGIAAMTVVWHHWHAATEVQMVRWYMVPFFAGHEAVILFFVLSGYVLSLPTWTKRTAAYPEYLVRRVSRIYLPYLAADQGENPSN